MIWELDALKILARNPTVPSIALQDTISEIERLNKQNEKLRSALEAISIGMLYPKEFAADALKKAGKK